MPHVCPDAEPPVEGPVDLMASDLFSKKIIPIDCKNTSKNEAKWGLTQASECPGETCLSPFCAKSNAPEDGFCVGAPLKK